MRRLVALAALALVGALLWRRAVAREYATWAEYVEDEALFV